MSQVYLGPNPYCLSSEYITLVMYHLPPNAEKNTAEQILSCVRNSLARNLPSAHCNQRTHVSRSRVTLLSGSAGFGSCATAAAVLRILGPAYEGGAAGGRDAGADGRKRW